MEDVFMGSSPVLALLLPLSVIIATAVYVITGSLAYGLIAFVVDAVPVSFIYMTQLKARKSATSSAQDRLARYSSLDDR
jgi:hypothetical protein